VAADVLTRDANLNRLRGLEPIETKQPSGEFLQRIHPDDRAVVARAFGTCIQQGRPVNLEFQVVQPDGAVRWLRHQGGFSSGPDGGTPHVAGSNVDVTDLMETEEALRRARKELEDRAAARTSKLVLKSRARDRTSAREVCEAARQLAMRANEAARLATTPKMVQGAARLVVATARATESALGLAHDSEYSGFEIVEREWIEAIWTEVRRAIVTGEEEQRRRISRELHDQMGQNSASLIIGMTALQPSVAEGSDAARQLERLVELAHRIDDQVHRIALELRPTALDDLGLHVTLLNLAEEWGERTQVAVDFRSRGLEHRCLPPEVESAVLRIVQESLTNVQKHAAASRVGLILGLRGNDLVVIVEDDGAGFDPEEVVAGRLGIRGMRERAALVGGDLEIESRPGEGTTVFLRIPLRPAAGETTDA
jgi:signal transduction histidine kinase